MVETSAAQSEADESFVRQGLVRKIAVAGVLIVALVASLVMFDAVFVQSGDAQLGEEAVSPAVAVTPAAPAPEVADADVVPDSGAEADPAPAPAEQAAPVVPALSPPAEGQASAKTAATVPAPVAKPATRQDGKSISQPEPPRDSRQAQAVPEGTAAPQLPSRPTPPEVRPAMPQITPVAPLAQQQSLVNRRNYLVQMGVFSNIANAEDLKRRLDKAGIPAQIEARVQVGPFKNKTEAEVAQKKLAEMGLSGLLVSPRK